MMKISIRESATETLSACLDIVEQRNSALRTLWYQKLLDESNRGYKTGAVETIHGSLLATGVLLTKTESVRRIGRAFPDLHPPIT